MYIHTFIFITMHTEEKILSVWVSATLVRRLASSKGSVHDQGKAFCTIFAEPFYYELQYNEH